MPQRSRESSKTSKVKTTPAETYKLGVRLVKPVNDAVREMARYKGDLAKFIVEAIMDVELDRVRLVVIDEAKIPDTTVRVEKPVFDRLASLAKRRNTSMNVLVNTAVAHWLESKRQRVRFVSE